MPRSSVWPEAGLYLKYHLSKLTFYAEKYSYCTIWLLCWRGIQQWGTMPMVSPVHVLGSHKLDHTWPSPTPFQWSLLIWLCKHKAVKYPGFLWKSITASKNLPKKTLTSFWKGAQDTHTHCASFYTSASAEVAKAEERAKKRVREKNLFLENYEFHI